MERQALAMMDHPHIAHVLDVGPRPYGRPYFAMEWVRGRKITDFCNEQHLDIRQRLELFIEVCQAIQHAHQKGVIHRDIKPSNVLVSMQDGKPPGCLGESGSRLHAVQGGAVGILNLHAQVLDAFADHRPAQFCLAAIDEIHGSRISSFMPSDLTISSALPSWQVGLVAERLPERRTPIRRRP